jgi:hypothetical protein
MEEESSFVKDMLGGLRSLLKERLVSPLIPAFILSWLMWNYRVVLTIFSHENLETKFSVIEGMFPTFWVHCIDGVLIPLLFSLAYIYLYPFVSIPIYRIALINQGRLRGERQKAEKEKLLSEEDKQKILAFAYDQKVNSQKQIDQQLQENEQLRAKIAELEKSHQPVAVPYGLEQKYREDSITVNLKNITEDKIKVLRILGNAEEQDKNIDYMPERDLQKRVAYNTTDLRIILEELERGNFIQKFSAATGNEYKLNYEGRKALVEKDKEVNGQPAAEALAAQKEGYNSVSTEMSKQTNDSSDLSAKQQLSKTLPTGLSEYISSPVKVKEYIKNEAMKVPVLELNEENIRSRFYGLEVDWDLNIDSIEMQKNNSAIVTGSPESSVVWVKALVNLQQNPDVKLLTKKSKAKFVGTISSIEGVYAITLQDARIYALNNK